MKSKGYKCYILRTLVLKENNRYTLVRENYFFNKRKLLKGMKYLEQRFHDYTVKFHIKSGRIKYKYYTDVMIMFTRRTIHKPIVTPKTITEKDYIYGFEEVLCEK